jgi:hypothetical protein
LCKLLHRLTTLLGTGLQLGAGCWSQLAFPVTGLDPAGTLYDMFAAGPCTIVSRCMTCSWAHYSLELTTEHTEPRTWTHWTSLVTTFLPLPPGLQLVVFFVLPWHSTATRLAIKG